MNFAFYLHDEEKAEEFERKLLWFKSRYNLVSADDLREYLCGGKELRNSCMLSVDDGWRSTYDVIFPVMKKHNVPFTIFVSPEVCKAETNFWYYTYRYCDERELKQIMIDRGYFTAEVMRYPGDLIFKEIPIDDVYDVIEEWLSRHPEVKIPRGFMNTAELLELRDSGLVEIGAHTITHPILSAESRERSREEIIESVGRLSDILGREVHSFAYPNGLTGIDYSAEEMGYASEAGIDLAFSVDTGVITPETNRLSIPRWGSQTRLRFGRLGQYLPSLARQAQKRVEIRRFRR
ncbi:MAG: polysaccharide deacetylase family protein [Muribaculaceae bacterium]|nr:polysaccharide deacetylase family protein [Muribaculaceae bacterium]